MWTAVALAGPVGMGLVAGEFGERWFWLAVAGSVTVHVFLVWKFIGDLPFDNTLNTLWVGGLEAAFLMVASGKIRDSLPPKR